MWEAKYSGVRILFLASNLRPFPGSLEKGKSIIEPFAVQYKKVRNMTRRARTTSSISRHQCRSSSPTGRYEPLVESRVFLALLAQSGPSLPAYPEVIFVKFQPSNPRLLTLVLYHGSRPSVRHNANPCRRSRFWSFPSESARTSRP